jgi:hypothetical protein
MINHIGKKWRDIWTAVNNWVLAIDVDPLEEIRLRIRRLETPSTQFRENGCEERGRTINAPDQSTEIQRRNS